MDGLTSTGLVPSPLTDLVRYDWKWSYLVSHNPQTDRFSSPYPELGVVGSTPLALKKKRSSSEPIRLPEIEPKINQLKRNRDKKESDSTVEGKHLRLKFGDKKIVENGALELKEVNQFFHGGKLERAEDISNPGSRLPTEAVSEIVSGIKIIGINDKEESQDSLFFKTPSRRSSNKVSVAFCKDQVNDVQGKSAKSGGDSARGSANFLRLRALRDAEEGTSLRKNFSNAGVGVSISVTNNGIPYPSGQDIKINDLQKNRRSRRSSGYGSSSGSGQLVKNPEFNLGSEGRLGGGSILRHRGSILKRESKESSALQKKQAIRASVAFQPTSVPTSTTNNVPASSLPEGLKATTFAELRSSFNFQEGAPLHLGSGKNEENNPKSEESVLDRHEGHTKEFEKLRVHRIKVDEKEEGKLFRLSFNPTDRPNQSDAPSKNQERSSENKNHEDDAVHVKFPNASLKHERTNSFEEFRRNKIVPEEKKEGSTFLKSYRVYHCTDGDVYGFPFLFPGKDDRRDLRKFYMSRKEKPQDRITLLAHDDGHVFGFYQTDDTPKKTCLRHNEESLGDDPPAFQLIYDTSNAVVGFKTSNPKDDHSADFERLRQEMIIKGEKEEGQAFKTLCNMVKTEGVNLEEHLPLKHCQDQVVRKSIES